MKRSLHKSRMVRHIFSCRLDISTQFGFRCELRIMPPITFQPKCSIERDCDRSYMHLKQNRSICLGLVLCLTGCRGHEPSAATQRTDDVSTSTAANNQAAASDLPTEVNYIQLYASADGETHFREATVPLTPVASSPPAQPSAQSELQPATTIRHSIFQPNWGVNDRDQSIFHNPSSRRFVTVRRGTVWVKASDGETRQFQAGDVVEVLDVAPSKGHITWVGTEPAIVLYSSHP